MNPTCHHSRVEQTLACREVRGLPLQAGMSCLKSTTGLEQNRLDESVVFPRLAKMGQSNGQRGVKGMARLRPSKPAELAGCCPTDESTLAAALRSPRRITSPMARVRRQPHQFTHHTCLRRFRHEQRSRQPHRTSSAAAGHRSRRSVNRRLHAPAWLQELHPAGSR